MTIAACFVTPEGVVLGADSTTTVGGAVVRYLTNAQKIFEVGESSRLAVVTWGVGAFGSTSHRQLIAQLVDALNTTPPKNVADAATVLADMAWNAFESAFRSEIAGLRKTITDPASTPDAVKRAQQTLDNEGTGFCIAGVLDDHVPAAYKMLLTGSLTGPPKPEKIEGLHFWGESIFIYRAIGVWLGSMNDILATGKWTGTETELREAIFKSATPIMTVMPIRDAIDAVHSMLQMTVKFLKFVSLPPTCGGPIEIAAITADRKFRWVKHKPLAAALEER